MTTSVIRSTLVSIGAIDNGRVVQFAQRTRDRNVPVWLDPVTRVIFIDDYYVGDEEYSSGTYREDLHVPDFDDWSDTRRRVNEFRSLYFGRSVLDFGCGAGNFLRSIQTEARSVEGVELQDSFRDELQRDGIDCFKSLADCSSTDVIFMFHVLEHLPDPLTILRQVKKKLNESKGLLVVEVPHARDFLISSARSQPFIDFTLWSQHLILHTRDSLERLLACAGFTDVAVQGVQRYGLANHMKWLVEGKPGGHRDSLALLETEDLSREYAAALARMDFTDTLVATAR